MHEPEPNDFEDLLAECLERVYREGRNAVEDVCRENPGRAASIRRAVESLRHVGLLGEPRAAAGDDRFPERLGEFRLVDRIGSGGMGVVFLADEIPLRRRVALKLIRPEHLFFPGARARFRREVEVVARLQHPGIVPIHRVGEADGIPYFAMEWIDGVSLAQVLERIGNRDPERLTDSDLFAAPARRPRAEAAAAELAPLAAPVGRIGSSWVTACLDVARRVADALHHAHERGVIHRDVKPSNVLLSRAGEPVLIDFGLAKLAQADGKGDLTRTGIPVGSLPYMAPEQLRDPGAPVDRRTDVYQLGVTLHELLTLRAPFVAEDAERTRRLVLEGDAEPIRSRNRSVPRDAEIVCRKAMDRDPARRYATAAAFARDLSNVLSHRPIEARRPSATTRARRWAQRHPGTAAILALGLLILVGSIAFAVREGRSLDAIRRLADARMAREVRARSDAFWPADPARLTEIERWLADASSLAARLHEHRAALAILRTRALPYSDADRESDAGEPRRRRDALAFELASLLDYVGESDALRLENRVELSELEAEIAAAELSISTRRTWRFEDSGDQWVHDLLTELVSELSTLPELIRLVEEQERVATTIIAPSVASERARWDAAIEDIATLDAYGGLEIEPQLGLVPIRRNPSTNLWEFAHVLSGEPARASRPVDSPGGLDVTADTGVVLVLLPGGRLRMGAAPPSLASSPSRGAETNRDPHAHANERPVHDVALDPFFIARHELTQAQSRRLGFDYPWKVTGDLLPATSMNWHVAHRLVRAAGLDLPTEAQWEYACRAGTDTVFHTGDDAASLDGFENLRDAAYRREAAPEDAGAPVVGFDDGYARLSPVGRFRPNGFGLFDAHGNVSEMCRDVHVSRAYSTMRHAAGDGALVCVRGGQSRSIRGGSWAQAAEAARSAYRPRMVTSEGSDTIGVRPARPLVRSRR